MEKLEVGEYIRTKDGIIAKITDIVKEYCIDCDNDVFDVGNSAMMEIPWEHIKEYDGKIHTQDDIKTILTKEQYMQNCYKVEESK